MSLADHKPGLEREANRVRALGGRVEFARCWRIISTARGANTGLAVSRSLGDLDFKEPIRCGLSLAARAGGHCALCMHVLPAELHTVTSRVVVHRLVESRPEVGRVFLQPEDAFVILASDGLWDVLDDQAAVDVAKVGSALAANSCRTVKLVWQQLVVSLDVT